MNLAKLSPFFITLGICVLIWSASRTYRRRKMNRQHQGSSFAGVVRDRNPAHYPYSACLLIDGMLYRGCAHRVEMVLNSIPGVWAEVSLARHEAIVHMKTDVQEYTFSEKIHGAGYILLSCRPIEKKEAPKEP